MTLTKRVIEQQAKSPSVTGNGATRITTGSGKRPGVHIHAAEPTQTAIETEAAELKEGSEPTEAADSTVVEAPAETAAAWNPSEKEFFNKMQTKWRGHVRHGLQVRHEMGGLIVTAVGEPPNLQPRGQRILEETANQLKINRSDLSRMRWFAFHFATFNDFENRHPDIKTWDAVKKLIAELNDEQTEDKKTSAGVTEKHFTVKQREKVLDKYDKLKTDIGKMMVDFSIAQLASLDEVHKEIGQVTTDATERWANRPKRENG